MVFVVYQINRKISKAEEIFNFFGGLPGIAIPSGCVRVGLGAIQLQAGLVVGSFGVCGQILHPQSRKMENLTQAGGEQVLHGAVNAIRGAAEAVIGMTLVGSLGLFLAQLQSKEGFAPRIKYLARKTGPC